MAKQKQFTTKEFNRAHQTLELPKLQQLNVDDTRKLVSFFDKKIEATVNEACKDVIRKVEDMLTTTLNKFRAEIDEAKNAQVDKLKTGVAELMSDAVEKIRAEVVKSLTEDVKAPETTKIPG